MSRPSRSVSYDVLGGSKGKGTQIGRSSSNSRSSTGSQHGQYRAGDKEMGVGERGRKLGVQSTELGTGLDMSVQSAQYRSKQQQKFQDQQSTSFQYENNDHLIHDDKVGYKRSSTTKRSVQHVSISGLDQVIDPPFSFGDYPDGEPTLALCNDKLLGYIDKTRVLAEAKDLQGGLPKKLQEKSTISVEFGETFKFENEKYRNLIKDSKAKLNNRRELLERLKKENKSLQGIQDSVQNTLVEKRSTLARLELEQANIEGQLKTHENHRVAVMEQIKVMEIDIQASKNKMGSVSTRFDDIDIQVRESKKNIPEDFSLQESLNAEFDSKRSSEEREIIIKTSNRYLEKMKQNLTKYRKMYQERYQQFILRIGKDAEEIMSLYLEVGAYIRTGAEDENKREFDFKRNKNSEARIKALNHDIRELKIKIQTIEANLDTANNQYKSQLSRYEDDSTALRGKLKELFHQFTEFARWKCSVQGELSVFGELLVQEQGRMGDSSGRALMKAEVFESTSRSSFHSSSFSSLLTDDAARKASRSSRRDSGIFSPEPGLQSQMSSESNFLANLEADVVDARAGGRGNHVSRVYMGYSM